MELTARIETLRLAETFVISREASDEAEVVQVELRHDGVSGFGEAAPIERYGESAASALAYVEEHAPLLGDDPFALEEIEARLPRGRERRARGAGRARSTTCRGSSSACPSGGCSACRAPGRRPRGRSGSAIRTTWRAAPSGPRRVSGG